MQKIEIFFYKLISKIAPAQEDFLPKEDVKKILILRNNPRIGNIYFLIPFIKMTQACYPNAQVDVMVLKDSQTKFLTNMGLGNIISSNLAFGSLKQFFKSIKTTRKTHYDMLLMPHNSSTDAIIGSMLKAKNKVSFEDKKYSIIFKNAVPECEKSQHAALSPLSLLFSLGFEETPCDHTINFSNEEFDNGINKAKQLKNNKDLVFCYFRGARGKKVIHNDTWLNIIKKFDQSSKRSIQWVEILSPDIGEPLVAEQHSNFQTKNLRELGAVLANTDMFLCADTGPLHLADAANARCVGLFNQTTPEQYGCLGKNSLNIDKIDQLNPHFILNHFGLPIITNG